MFVGAWLTPFHVSHRILRSRASCLLGEQYTALPLYVYDSVFQNTKFNVSVRWQVLMESFGKPRVARVPMPRSPRHQGVVFELYQHPSVYSLYCPLLGGSRASQLLVRYSAIVPLGSLKNERIIIRGLTTSWDLLTPLWPF